MSSEDKSYIDDLKKSLYSRTVPDVQSRRRVDYEEKDSDVQKDWAPSPEAEEKPVVLNTEYKSDKMSFFAKLFIGSAIFCVIVVGIGAYLFFQGTNLISADNISIDISGPVSIPGGEVVNFDITAKNNNKIDLELVDLTVDFPAGTTDPQDPSQTLKRYRKLLGNIPVDGIAKDSVQAIIFGEENLQKQIMVSITYSVKGSTSVFTKTKSYDVLVNSSPIRVDIATLKEVTSGQEFDIKVDLSSNSKENLKGILFEAVYPFGFNYISSTQNPISGKNVWNIGDIPAGGKRSFTIRGTLMGEDNDLRAFHFNVGAKGDNPVKIATPYLTLDREINIQKPFVSLVIDIGGDDEMKDYIGNFDRNSSVNIEWFNNLPTIVSNMKIVAKLEGSAYDNSSVRPDSGYYDSGSNTITWSQQTNPEFSSVGPGDSGKVIFNLIPKDFTLGGRSVTNPKITITASVSGNRTQETNVPLTVTASTKRNIIIPSSVDLSARVARSVGPFQNSGFMPPKVDTPTTYTVIWSISNTTNSIRDVEVKATLPPYVKWVNNISPSGENIVYDENSGLVTWNVGSVEANRISAERREVAFQIAFIPSIIQVSSSPVLVNQARLTGIDNFTNSKVDSNQDPLTTRYSTDPSYKPGDEVVTQ
jgi:hypothetical protein